MWTSLQTTCSCFYTRESSCCINNEPPCQQLKPVDTLNDWLYGSKQFADRPVAIRRTRRRRLPYLVQTYGPNSDPLYRRWLLAYLQTEYKEQITSVRRKKRRDIPKPPAGSSS